MQSVLRKARGGRGSAAAARLRLGLGPWQVHASSQRYEEEEQAFLMNSMDRMRARCTVPRDVVQVYEALNKVRRAASPPLIAPSRRGASHMPAPTRWACNMAPRFACCPMCTCPRRWPTGRSSLETRERTVTIRHTYADKITCLASPRLARLVQMKERVELWSRRTRRRAARSYCMYVAA
jgi:hypothetical protein